MKPSDKETYHDYVIKDGRFIGKFDEMYQRFDDPWHQTEAAHNRLSKSRNAAILNMQKYKIGSVVEFGCGLGHFTHLIATSGVEVTGVDLSATAVEKARQRFPNLHFVNDDVKNLRAYASADAVLFAEITWYILDQLPRLFDEMLDFFRGKHFIQNLTFYKPGVQRYGTQLFTTFDEFARFCPFPLIEWSVASETNPQSSIETSAIFLVDKK